MKRTKEKAWTAPDASVHMDGGMGPLAITRSGLVASFLPRRLQSASHGKPYIALGHDTLDSGYEHECTV